MATSMPNDPLGINGVTDAGMKELAALKGLQTLHLFYTEVTDMGLKELAGLQRLSSSRLGR
jgi:internalin A